MKHIIITITVFDIKFTVFLIKIFEQLINSIKFVEFLNLESIFLRKHTT